MINLRWETYLAKTKEVLLRPQTTSFPWYDPDFPCHEVSALPSSNHSYPSPAERKRCTSFAPNKRWEKVPQGHLNWSNISQALIGWPLPVWKLSALNDVCVCVHASCESGRDVRIHFVLSIATYFTNRGINVYFKCSDMFWSLSSFIYIRLTHELRVPTLTMQYMLTSLKYNNVTRLDFTTIKQWSLLSRLFLIPKGLVRLHQKHWDRGTVSDSVCADFSGRRGEGLRWIILFRTFKLLSYTKPI